LARKRENETVAKIISLRKNLFTLGVVQINKKFSYWNWLLV